MKFLDNTRPVARIDAGKYITLFADASHCPHTKAYGWCFWAKFGDPAQTVVESGGGWRMKNSTYAEAEAILQALKFAATIPLLGRIVVLQSDCISALECERVQRPLKELIQLGARDAYHKHVKGHEGNKTSRSAVNSLCDRNARAKMRYYRERCEK